MPIFVHSLLRQAVDHHVQLDKQQHGKICEEDLQLSEMVPDLGTLSEDVVIWPNHTKAAPSTGMADSWL